MRRYLPLLPLLVMHTMAVIVAGQDFIDVNNVNLAENDARRHNYCGTSFWDAIDKCGTWCPNDDDSECTNGEKCYGDTLCTYTADLDATLPPIAAAVSSESPTLRPSLDAVETEQPSQRFSQLPSYQPSSLVSEEVEEDQDLSDTAKEDNSEDWSQLVVDDEEEDWSQLVLDGEGEDWSQLVVDGEEEDWTQVEETVQNLWCGTSQFDAIRNCGAGIKCDSGICPGTLKCFAVPGSCGDSSGNDTDETEDGANTVTTSTSVSTVDPDKAESLPDFDNEDSTAPVAPGDATTNSPSTPATQLIEEENDTQESTSPPTRAPAETPPDSITSPSFLVPELPAEDITDTLFCGYTLEDASTSCHKRCRNGSPGECPAGETCFRGVNCNSENPRPPPTSKPTLTPTPDPTRFRALSGRCAASYGELVNKCWSAMECNNTNICPQNETCFEDVDCATTSYSVTASPTISTALASTQNYCVEDESKLQSDCGIAPTCNDGDPPCPLGTICFGDHLCEIEKPTLAPSRTQSPTSSPSSGGAIYVPSEPLLLCASTLNDLEESCASAQSCNDGPCPTGLFCFPYNCESVTEEVSKSKFCARDVAELKESCGILEECGDGLSSCPGDYICMEYDCQQNIELCPLNFDGWHSSRECLEYYYCEHGIAGPIKNCPPGLKFDKTRGHCTDGKLNEYCYGGSPPPSTLKPTGPPLKNFCPNNNVDGWHASSNCKEYYKCENGEAGAIQVCGGGLKFDKVRNRCKPEESINNFCYGPAMSDEESQEVLMSSTPTPTPKPLEGEYGSCSNGYTGWQANPNCSQYFWCDDGIMGSQYDCGEGLLFDSVDKICTFADEVQCTDGSTVAGVSSSSAAQNIPAPTAAMTNFPSKKIIASTSFPTMANDKVWSETSSPTKFPDTPADPPWLSLTRKDESSAYSGMSILHSFLHITLSIYFLYTHW